MSLTNTETETQRRFGRCEGLHHRFLKEHVRWIARMIPSEENGPPIENKGSAMRRIDYPLIEAHDL
jgi:hypothetical protein